MPRETKDQRNVQLQVSANLLESEGAERVPKGVAYAFSSGGRLLAQEPLDERGRATLAFPAGEAARSVRVMVGPQVEKERAQIAELQRRGAAERSLRIDPGDLTPSVEIPIIPDKWRCWLLSRCYVQGTLLKRTVSGGIPVDLPVCNATVEIYEVDPIWIIIPKLPDLEIERIRDVIINPPPPPPPPDGPFPPIGPPGPFPPPLPLFPGPGLRAIASAARMAAPAEGALGTVAAMGSMQAMSGSADLQFLARTTNTEQFRKVLVDRAPLIRHILCLFFPPLVSTQLVATATTDECGHFQTWFWRSCVDPDTPDLYFKAKQRLFGFFNVTIYAPTPIPCFTHWDYVCGTEVTLYTTNPFAVTCPPCPPVIAPDNWVLVMAVGNFPLSRIRGTGESLQPTTYATNLGLTDGDAPWGGLLRFRLEFDNSLRDDLGVRYYQASWRKGTLGAFTPMTMQCHRHYAHMVGADLVLTPYTLGPQVVGATPNLFEIPPALPPLGQWSFPELTEDLTNAKFPTTDLAPLANPGVAWPEHGKYQIKFDLYDSAGNPVNIVALGIKWRVPTSTDLSGTIETDDASTLGLVSGNSFIMTLHIDNSRCSASIAAPKLDGTPASDNCGVLEYDPNAPGSVLMEWIASHPNGIGSDGFATYSFAVYRGVNLLVIPSGLPTLPSSGRAHIGAVGFSNTQAVNDLLGGCTVAGFSENLYVWAMATDGWARLSQYDAAAVRAFVLAPEPPSP